MLQFCLARCTLYFIRREEGKIRMPPLKFILRADHFAQFARLHIVSILDIPGKFPRQKLSILDKLRTPSIHREKHSFANFYIRRGNDVEYKDITSLYTRARGVNLPREGLFDSIKSLVIALAGFMKSFLFPPSL